MEDGFPQEREQGDGDERTHGQDPSQNQRLVMMPPVRPHAV